MYIPFWMKLLQGHLQISLVNFLIYTGIQLIRYKHFLQVYYFIYGTRLPNGHKRLTPKVPPVDGWLGSFYTSLLPILNICCTLFTIWMCYVPLDDNMLIMYKEFTDEANKRTHRGDTK